MTDPLDFLYWRDEILEIMYWLRGEGLGETVQPAELANFLSPDRPVLEQYMDRLVEEGLLAREEGAPGRYRLTELGIKEGGRRFADEFAGLTGQAHGECNNPNCSCQTLGPEACEARTPHAH